MPKRYRSKKENLFEWSCQKPHSKSSEGSKVRETKPLERQYLCPEDAKRTRKSFEKNPVPEEFSLGKVHTLKI
jgi:hypothetical protein